MRRIAQEHLNRFVTAAHRVAEYGLVIAGCGNLSWRLNDGLMLLTTTGSWMADLTLDDIAVCRTKDAATLNERKPSKEIGFHAGILRERADVNVVLHCQSPWATAIACRNPQPEDFSVIPEIPYYIGRVAVVPYLDPGSEELAQAVISAMRGHELAILRSHGQVVVGADLNEAIAKAAHFEMACQIILGAQTPVRFLPEDAIAVQRRERQVHRTGRR
jgi:ribulose-5-phosphate 4-epimerase/fuculose-1-phosphate aldolase